MCMAVSVVDALKRAVESTKLDRGLKKYFQMRELFDLCK